jgi:hypothetical protein
MGCPALHGLMDPPPVLAGAGPGRANGRLLHGQCRVKKKLLDGNSVATYRATVVDRSIFQSDDIPDATWGLCQVHAPAGIVRLVDDRGVPSPGGMCKHCWEESKNEAFFSCPIHGLQPKVPGRDGCPVKIKDGDAFLDCVGASPGPSEDEIARESQSIGRLWPGGAPTQQNAVDAPVPESPGGRDREALEGPEDQAGEDARHDRERVVDRPPWRDPFRDP